MDCKSLKSSKERLEEQLDTVKELEKDEKELRKWKRK